VSLLWQGRKPGSFYQKIYDFLLIAYISTLTWSFGEFVKDEDVKTDKNNNEDDDDLGFLNYFNQN